MAFSFATRLRWGRVLAAGLLGYAFAVVVITVIITVYAFIVWFQVQEALDQSRIQGLADGLYASWGVVMIAAASFLGTLWAVRRKTALLVLHGLLVGTVAGTVHLAVSGISLQAFVELGIYSERLQAPSGRDPRREVRRRSEGNQEGRLISHTHA